MIDKKATYTCSSINLFCHHQVMREKNGAFSSGHGSLCRGGGEEKERGREEWKLLGYTINCANIIDEKIQKCHNYCLDKINATTRKHANHSFSVSKRVISELYSSIYH